MNRLVGRRISVNQTTRIRSIVRVVFDDFTVDNAIDDLIE